MREKACLLILLIAAALLSLQQPTVQAQSTSNLALSFHAYSVVLREPNGSLIVYDGADGYPPDKSSADQANLNAQITGTRSGFTFYSALAMWAVQLPCDLHVSGSVTIRAYISSTYKLSGFFSGAGYGMGLVDIDENNNEVKQFIIEGPQYIGGNPFSATPTLYTLSTNVDYTFKKGHAIGFFVGVGATEKGFTATVHFGSSDRNSGATLPVIQTTQTQTIASGSGTIAVSGNSAFENLKYDPASRTISFTAQLISGTAGTCAVAIPKTLMQPAFTVTLGAQTITATLTENATYYQLTFTHTRNTNSIQIKGTPPNPSPTQTANPTQSDTPSQTASPSQTTAPSQTGATGEPSSSPGPSPTVPEYPAIIALLLVFIVFSLVTAVLKLRRKIG